MSVARERGRAIVRVKDSGEGIDPAFLPHVFEPFRQGASGTHALGPRPWPRDRPAPGRSARRSHHRRERRRRARLDVHGIVAGGARARRRQCATAGAEPDFQHLHVLVAEDDADSAAAVTAILRLHGCETQTAPTAAECLRITGEWPTDVLICDVGLARR